MRCTLEDGKTFVLKPFVCTIEQFFHSAITEFQHFYQRMSVKSVIRCAGSVLRMLRTISYYRFVFHWDCE